MFSTASDSFDSAITTSFSFLENKYMATLVATLIILYGSLVAPALPRTLAVALKNPLVKFVLIFVIAYVSSKNPTIALIITIGLIVSLMTLQAYETRDAVSKQVAVEIQKFTNNGMNGGMNGYMNGDMSGELLGHNGMEYEDAPPEAEAEMDAGMEMRMGCPAGDALAPIGNDACPFPGGICHYNNQNNHPDNYNHYNYNNDTYEYSKNTADVAGENVGPVGMQSGFSKSAMPL